MAAVSPRRNHPESRRPPADVRFRNPGPLRLEPVRAKGARTTRPVHSCRQGNPAWEVTCARWMFEPTPPPPHPPCFRAEGWEGGIVTLREGLVFAGLVRGGPPGHAPPNRGKPRITAVTKNECAGWMDSLSRRGWNREGADSPAGKSDAKTGPGAQERSFPPIPESGSLFLSTSIPISISMMTRRNGPGDLDAGILRMPFPDYDTFTSTFTFPCLSAGDPSQKVLDSPFPVGYKGRVDPASCRCATPSSGRRSPWTFR